MGFFFFARCTQLSNTYRFLDTTKIILFSSARLWCAFTPRMQTFNRIPDTEVFVRALKPVRGASRSPAVVRGQAAPAGPFVSGPGTVWETPLNKEQGLSLSYTHRLWSRTAGGIYGAPLSGSEKRGDPLLFGRSRMVLRLSKFFFFFFSLPRWFTIPIQTL